MSAIRCKLNCQLLDMSCDRYVHYVMKQSICIFYKHWTIWKGSEIFVITSNEITKWYPSYKIQVLKVSHYTYVHKHYQAESLVNCYILLILMDIKMSVLTIPYFRLSGIVTSILLMRFLGTINGKEFLVSPAVIVVMLRWFSAKIQPVKFASYGK